MTLHPVLSLQGESVYSHVAVLEDLRLSHTTDCIAIKCISVFVATGFHNKST